MKEIYGLRYDYEQRNGTCLIFDREDGIKEDELSRIQTKMLQTGQVPRLLQFSAEQTDGAVALAYEIGTRRVLKQALRTDGLTLSQLLQLLVTVTATLEECRSYMLRERGFLLQEPFLFVNRDLTDVCFVYLPITSLSKAPTVQEDMKLLIERLTSELPAENRHVMGPFISYCESGAFRVKELKRRLIERLTSPTPHSDDPLTGLNLKPDNNDIYPPPFHPQPDWFEQPKPDEQEALPLGNKPLVLRKRISVCAAAFGAIGSAWLWNRCLENPSPSLIQLAAGITLLSAASWLLLRYAIDNDRLVSLIPARFRGRLSDTASSSNANHMREEEANLILPADPLDFVKHAEFAPVVIPFPNQPLATTGPMTAERYYASLGQHTTLLRPNADATVLLRPEFASLHIPQARAYLEIDAEHPAKRIPLGKDIFILGRSVEHTDYRLEGTEVSRQHIEIVKEQDTFACKDLGSTNGTLWNGERMVPYRSYPLQEGDCITVAQTELRFRFVANARKTV